ncbi:MAG: monofunctional biosynthetic peptidoglycan transglycosylase, partial [Sphingomonadaceae bacterium]
MLRLTVFLVKLMLGLALFSVLWVLLYAVVPPPVTATMLMDEHGMARDWTPIERIDSDMVRAAIAAEDSRFCQHDGFDREAIEQALEERREGRRYRGGSSISQQTAKNAFLWQGGGFFRKGIEAWFTFLIEKIWGKRRIMEVYLNIAETGLGTYGVEAGAQRYFGHGADDLSRDEAARIAAVLPQPKRREAISPSGFTRRYGNMIAARIGTVAGQGLDACVYAEGGAPADMPEPVPAPAARPSPPP